MTFIPYLFKKDLNRLKIIFLAWALLIFAQLALGIGSGRLMAEYLQFQVLLPMCSKLIGILQGMMVIVIVPLIIQTDSIVGTTAFWFTRPISKKGLLVTKSCLVLILLVLIPLIAELCVLTSQGATARQLFLAVPEIIIEKIAFIIPFVILAALTPKFSRYALVGIIVFVTFIVVAIVWSILSVILSHYKVITALKYSCPNTSKYLFSYKSGSLKISSNVVQDIYIILLGSALITYQFLTRHTAKTLKWLIVAFLIMICFTKMWNLDFLKENSAANFSAATAESLTVGFDANYISVADEPRMGKNDARLKSVNVIEIITGLPAGQFAILKHMKDVQMTYPDGNTVKSEYVSTKQINTYSNEQSMLPIQTTLKDVKLLNTNNGEFSYTEIFSLDESSFQKLKDIKGTYSASADFDLYKYEIVSRMPLKEDAKGMFGAEQVVIYNILHRTDAMSIIINEKKINLLFDRSIKKKSMEDIAQDMYSGDNYVYLIVNKKLHEAFWSEVEMDMYGGVMDMYSPKRFKTKAKRLDFINLAGRNEDKEWLKDAELIRLNAIKIGEKTVDFKVENFAIPSQSTVTAPENIKDKMEKQLKMQDRKMNEKTPK
jgi:hypothetical protein